MTMCRDNMVAPLTFESDNAEADLPAKWGRLRGQGINRRKQPFVLSG
jgi:hypothetical protein